MSTELSSAQKPHRQPSLSATAGSHSGKDSHNLQQLGVIPSEDSAFSGSPEEVKSINLLILVLLGALLSPLKYVDKYTLSQEWWHTPVILALGAEAGRRIRSSRPVWAS